MNLHLHLCNCNPITMHSNGYVFPFILCFSLPFFSQLFVRPPQTAILLFCIYWICQSLWLCGSHQLWKILKEMGIPDHLTCLLRNLYAGQEATVRTGHGTTDWFQIGKGVRQGCILSPCLFSLYAEHIMRNAGLEEAQAGIKIAGRNVNNLRYADDTTLMEPQNRKKPQVLTIIKYKAITTT